MHRHDFLDCLRMDAGKLTIGELVQQREAAAQEIARLWAKIEQLMTAASISGVAEFEGALSAGSIQLGMLIRLKELCQLLGVSRSTIYEWVNAGKFPAPVKLSARSVRWRKEDIERWCRALHRI